MPGEEELEKILADVPGIDEKLKDLPDPAIRRIMETPIGQAVLGGFLAAVFLDLIIDKKGGGPMEIFAFISRCWRSRRRRRCRNCRHFAEQYIIGLHGQGLFRFGHCQRLVHDCRIVEPDIGRKCKDYEGISEEDSKLALDVAEGPRNPKVSIFTPGK